MYIESKFETQYVIENFGKLRNIILNTQEEIIEYMVQRQAQAHVSALYEENRNRQTNAQNSMYRGYSENRHSMA